MKKKKKKKVYKKKRQLIVIQLLLCMFSVGKAEQRIGGQSPQPRNLALKWTTTYSVMMLVAVC
jgi:hypothetical protein